MRVMITGGTGFIGSWVVRLLLERGHEAVILARDPGKVRGFVDRPGVELVAGSLADDVAIERALHGADACVHVALGWGDTAVDMARNDTVPSLRIFQTAVEQGVQQIVYTSSIAVFGDPADVYRDRDAVSPDTLYGATKAAAEAYLLGVAAGSGVRANVIRPGYTFGEPAVDGATIYTDRKLADMVRLALRNEPIDLVAGAGTQFVWVGDLAQAYLAVLEGDVDRSLFTVVSRDFTAWSDVAQRIIELTGSTSDLRLRDEGVDPTWGRNDVDGIADAFDMRFDSREPMARHLEYLVAEARRG